MKTMKASDFKTQAFAVLEAVARTGEGVIVLKRGQPIAQLIPFQTSGEDYPQRRLRGSVKFRGALLAPAEPAEAWEALQGGDA